MVAAVLILPALLVGSVGTYKDWKAWTYLAILLIPMTLTAGFLLTRDPELLARRLSTGEKDPAQSHIVALSGLCFLAIMLIPGLRSQVRLVNGAAASRRSCGPTVHANDGIPPHSRCVVEGNSDCSLDPMKAAATNGALRIDESTSVSGHRLPISPLRSIIVRT
jgi:hypothetical protein